MSNPSFEDFESERAAVIQEASEYQGRDDWMLTTAPFVTLLSHDHYMNKYLIGTRDQLLQQSPSDLQYLYEAAYGPENLFLVIAGNFQNLPGGKAPLNEAEIVEALEKAFQAPQKKTKDNPIPAPREIQIPSIVPAQGEPWVVQFQSKSAQTRDLLLVFDVPTAMVSENPEAFETMRDFINLQIKGSLHDLLVSEGLASGVGCYSESVNNLHLLSVGLSLTPQGASDRGQKALKIIFDYIGRIQRDGIPESVLNLLRLSNVNSYEESIYTSRGAARFLSNHVVEGPIDQSLFELRKRFNAVTSDSIVAALRNSFQPDRLLMTYQGADVQSETVSPVLGRAFVVERAPELKSAIKYLVATPSAAPIQFMTGEIPLNFRSEALAEADKAPVTMIDERLGVRALIEEVHTQALGASSLSLRMAPVSAKTATAMVLFDGMFAERFSSQLSYLTSIGVLQSVRASAGISISVKGNPQASEEALLWLLDQIISFEPTEAELNLARNSFRESIEASEQNFTAQLLWPALTSTLDRYSFHSREMEPFLDGIDVNQIKNARDRLLKRADIQLTQVGDFTQQSLEALLKAIRSRVPDALTDLQRARYANRDLKVKDLKFWLPLGPSKSEEDLGRMWAYEGPQISTKDYAAFLVLSSVIGNAVTGENRERQKLGYIHSAAAMGIYRRQVIAFYGGVTGDSKMSRDQKEKLMEAGWQRIINELVDPHYQGERLITDDILEISKAAMIIKRDILELSQSDRRSKLSGALYVSDDPDYHEKLNQLIRSLTVEDIRSAARRYLESSRRIDIVGTQTKPENCAGALSEFAKARRLLAQKW